MALDSLPYILENTMMTLLEQEVLQSWNINGKENQTVVTLRFSKQGMVDNVMDIKYKRVAPSQMKRDRERHENFKNKTKSDFDCQINKDFEDNLKKSVKQNQSLNIDTVDTVAEAEPKIQGACGGSMTTDHNNINPPIETDDKEGRNIDSQHVNSSEHISLLTNAESIQCCECNKIIEIQSWYKCTVCSNYNICSICKENNIHSKHSSRISIFTKPRYPKAGFCHSCGLQFYPENDRWFQLYNCSECSDYALCFKCNGLGKHSHHSQYINKITLDEYYKIIH